MSSSAASVARTAGQKKSRTHEGSGLVFSGLEFLGPTGEGPLTRTPDPENFTSWRGKLPNDVLVRNRSQALGFGGAGAIGAGQPSEPEEPRPASSPEQSHRSRSAGAHAAGAQQDSTQQLLR